MIKQEENKVDEVVVQELIFLTKYLLLQAEKR
jgi:hypothetical protein